MPKEQSVAPKERVNIRYKSAIGDAKEEIELPFRMLVLGDFSQQPDDRMLEDREPISINKDNFNKVLKEQNVKLAFSVPDTLTGKPDDEMNVELNIAALDDFRPDRIAQQVPELRRILEVRNHLTALKGRLGNDRDFVRGLNQILNDPALAQRIAAATKTTADAPSDAGASTPDAPPTPADDPAAGPQTS